jgi:hypothetical protein
MLILRYSSSTAFMSNLIRRACHSRFSHVDIVLPGEGLLGVSGEDKSCHDPGGVRIRPFEPWPYSIMREVTINTPLADTIIRTGKTQIGKPFDNDALYAFFNPFGAHRDWRELDKWFCSEWFIWSCEVEKLFPYKLCVPMNMINPNDSMLLLNPFMSTEDIDKLLN